MTARAHRWLAAVAGGLAALAAVAGSPSATSARVVAPTVGAIELAAWIRDRRPGLRVIDVRPDSEYAQFHVATARHVARAAFDTLRARDGETLVVYAGDDAASLEAARSTRGNAVVLRGGAAAWAREVLNPVLDPDSAVASERVAALSRYFGGVPRAGAPGSTTVPVPDDAALVVARSRGRGC